VSTGAIAKMEPVWNLAPETPADIQDREGLAIAAFAGYS
jgi:hypothetical protein